jgi:hypothetical protein
LCFLIFGCLTDQALPGLFDDVCKTIVVDWHHIDVGLDATFHFYVNPYPDPDPDVGQSELF